MSQNGGTNNGNRKIDPTPTSGNGWREVGESVSSTVQQAINTGDFSGLSNDIEKMVNQALEQMGRTITETVFTRQGKTQPWESATPTKNFPGYQNLTTGEAWKDTKSYEYIRKTNEERARRMGEEETAAVRGEYPRRESANTGGYGTVNARGLTDTGKVGSVLTERQKKILYMPTGTGKVLSILGMVLGYGAALAMGATFGAVGATGSSAVAIVMSVLSILPVGALVGAIFATLKFRQLSRFEDYQRILDNKTYVKIQTLAEMTDKSEKFVLKEIRQMILKKWFRQGHLDDQNTTLITSDASYEQYLETARNALEMKEKDKREKERLEKEAMERQAAQDAEFAGLPEETKQAIVQGLSYIEEIHRANDLIEGEEMSEKLARMEYSVRMIINRIKQEPGLTTEVRRLMSYYLPTAVKLLGAYIDLDAQEKDSENIRKSKKEIEDTIDTLNMAFDKLFDSLFDETNLDISTDAQVMKTLLEQEGLTGHQFSSNQVMGGNNSGE